VARRGSPIRLPFVLFSWMVATVHGCQCGSLVAIGRTTNIRRKEELMKLRNLGVLGAAGMLALTAAVPAFAQSPASMGTLKIGIDLPLSGGDLANGGPTRDGVLLAIQQANAAGGVGGYTLDANVQDDAVNGVHDPNQGATNAATLVADSAVVGMVGAFNSNVSRAIIPVTNEAGLAQCSPANTGVDLTKEGSEAYRPANPDVRNYFRVATPDDVQGPGLAQYAYNDLGKHKAMVVDDTEAFGVGVANTFSDEFIKLGGEVVDRQGNDYAQNKSFVNILTAASALGADVAFFGGTQTTGGGQYRKDMGQLGLLDIPLVGPDGTTDLAPGGTDGGFITLAGIDNAGNVFGSVAGIHDIPDPEAFAADFQAAFNAPPGAYSALAYACTQILMQALDTAIAGGATDPAAIREAVRAAVFSGQQYDTVLGPLSIDANGDSSQKFLSFYKTDTTLDDGVGGWVFDKQQDFAGEFDAPAPSGSVAP